MEPAAYVPKMNDLVQLLLEKEHIRNTIVRLKAEATEGNEPFVWAVLEKEEWQNWLPVEIKSGWIFVLKKDTPSECHYHPNSVQHMIMVEGHGKSQVGDEAKEMRLLGSGHEPQDTWYVIEKGVEHEFFPEKTNMVVISFHTCEADELQEISCGSGQKRTYEG